VSVTWTISHSEKLVIAVAEGELQHADVDKYLLALIAEGAMPYRKLFDLTFAPLSMGAAELRALGTRVAEHARAGGAIGPLAIVVGSDLALDMARIFETQARADRPLRIFGDVVRARAWLDSLSPSQSDREVSPR
jgi:hypothetical protein